MRFTETGKTIYNRTYSRTRPDGTKEEWLDTVERVVNGNAALVDREVPKSELTALSEMMFRLEILPAGRHLWATGVPGRQYLSNCFVAGWTEKPWEHFTFTFMRLMEGGGVGANYSFVKRHDRTRGPHEVHIVCRPDHPDFDKMVQAGVISNEFHEDWSGSYEVPDTREGWADALEDLMEVYWRDAKHKCRVFDVSRIRPEGTPLKTFGGVASGPKPLAIMLKKVAVILNSNTYLKGMAAMQIDHAIAECVVSGGVRRSARMAIMDWQDQAIFDFLACKSNQTEHWTTNISVAVDDDFWKLIEGAGANGFEGTNKAVSILKAIAKGMRTNGEPGIWNRSLSNVGEPNPVECTNPCGEIALEEWEQCTLGHINLAAFVDDDNGTLDREALIQAHKLMTRFLIRATFGDTADPKQQAVVARNRRIGVGHFGFAGLLAKMGIKYSDAWRTPWVSELLRTLKITVDKEAAAYAHELRIPTPVKTTTVAPTGTIAKLPGVTEGIHPVFAKYFIRRVRFSTVDPDQMAMVDVYREQGLKVEDCIYAPNTIVVEIPTKESLLAETEKIWGHRAESIVESADEISLTDLLCVQQFYQRHWADNAVSFTANVDPAKYSETQIKDILSYYGTMLKGTTIFPELSRDQSPYERITKEEYESGEIHSTADSLDEDCKTGACPIR